MNRGEEDYVKAIYEIESRQQSKALVTNLQLAQYFSHTAQTVNEMVKKLVKNKLIAYKPYKGSRLTEDGLSVAIRLIRLHRIWETFLVEKLGYSWEEVHEEAEKLEHITSNKMEERLFAFLGEPKVCPHGNPIPGGNSFKTIDEGIQIPLMDAVEKETYVIQSVLDEKAILSYLSGLDMGIGQEFLVSRIDSVSEFVELSVRDKAITIGYKVAKAIYVRKVKR